MERLALCSQVLYNVDLLHKHRQIRELEAKLKVPQVVFPSAYAAYTAVDRLCNTVKELSRLSWVDDSALQIEHNYVTGLTQSQMQCVYQAIEQALNNAMPNESQWCSKLASAITDNVDDMFMALLSTDVWSPAHAPGQSLDLVMSYVSNQLHNQLLTLYEYPAEE